MLVRCLAAGLRSTGRSPLFCTARDGVMGKTLSWPGGNRLAVWVKPRAGRDEVLGLREGALHVALAAPPLEGQANVALVRFLAKALGVRPRQVEIVSGQHSRHKIVRIAEIAPEELRRRVEEALQ